eukprot:TRINITY_DN8824_c0_g1_i1.p1 TRINITY_DN8824_c0_g1~~TRINITY_DN8824_c0_g1_i1.p1  ORF type:complete len:165 (-),score=26.93 TRINITY_DN8824_c0_g1_i1:41-535(-)
MAGTQQNSSGVNGRSIRGVGAPIAEDLWEDRDGETSDDDPPMEMGRMNADGHIMRQGVGSEAMIGRTAEQNAALQAARAERIARHLSQSSDVSTQAPADDAASVHAIDSDVSSIWGVHATISNDDASTVPLLDAASVPEREVSGTFGGNNEPNAAKDGRGCEVL